MVSFTPWPLSSREQEEGVLERRRVGAAASLSREGGERVEERRRRGGAAASLSREGRERGGWDAVLVGGEGAVQQIR